jgi:hypothetical protein
MDCFCCRWFKDFGNLASGCCYGHLFICIVWQLFPHSDRWRLAKCCFADSARPYFLVDAGSRLRLLHGGSLVLRGRSLGRRGTLAGAFLK